MKCIKGCCTEVEDSVLFMKMYRKQKSMTVTAQAAGDVMDLSLQELLGKKKKKSEAKIY